MIVRATKTLSSELELFILIFVFIGSLLDLYSEYLLFSSDTVFDKLS